MTPADSLRQETQALAPDLVGMRARTWMAARSPSRPGLTSQAARSGCFDG